MADDNSPNKPDYKKLNACVATVVAVHSPAGAKLSYEKYNNGNSGFVATTTGKSIRGGIFSNGDISTGIEGVKNIHVPAAVGYARAADHYKHVDATQGPVNVTGMTATPSPPPALEVEAVSMAKEVGACMNSKSMPVVKKSFQGLKP
jgi:hypothetical protein